MKKLLCIFGTRPEAIKMAPVIAEARRRTGAVEVRVCVTAQHREMLDQVLAVFGIVPDRDLDLMRPGQDLAGLTARAIEALTPAIREERPDILLTQGDTTTVFAASLAAFYERVPCIAHLEAGLRTGRKDAPFPEEINRRLTSHLADLHLAPTSGARANLLREGIAAETIRVTGNTVIDALLSVRERAARERPAIEGLSNADLRAAMGVVLITGHRRENFGGGFEAICGAIADLAEAHPSSLFVYPVHLNPNVREPVERLLGGLPNVALIEPLAYLPFVRLMDAATVVLTDSGGIQEEAPSLGKPVLVMREVTERPEAVEAGTVRLVGTDRARIVAETSRLLTDEAAAAAMSRAHNPYGDGRAAARVVDALLGLPVEEFAG